MKFGLETRASSNRRPAPAAQKSRTARGGERWRALIALVLGVSIALGATPLLAKPQRSAAERRAQARPAKPRRSPKRRAPAHPAKARRSKRRAPARVAKWAPSPAPPNTPAARYAKLSADECKAELTQRGIPYLDETAPGVEIPVRLLGPIGGVLYRTDAGEAERRHSPWEVFDCRLVLSLADFGEILARHEVVEARIFSAWRPLARAANSIPQRRHPAALAVDVRALKKANGEQLVILKDFHGRIGAPLCPPNRPPAGAAAAELLDIVCEAAAAHYFNSILTPNYNRAHKNHFHLELTPGVSWFLLR